MKKYIITALILLSLSPISFSKESVSVRLAESVMKRHPDVYGEWHYITGTVLKSFDMLWRKTGDEKYFQYIKKTVDHVLNEDGTIEGYDAKEYNIDQVAEGRAVLMLYQETGDKKYKLAVDSIRSQLDGHPRTSENGFWHKKIYPWQMWLDGLYMGAPFYAEYTKEFNRNEDYDDITLQFKLIKEHLYDPGTGLFYHAWDESRNMFWADKKTGLSQCFWGRGMGWYAMALVDVLETLPQDHQDREELIHIFNGVVDALEKYQDNKTGLWWQVLDKGGRFGNYLEASGSAMFVYAIAKGVRLGMIDDTYFQIAQKGYEGILENILVEDSVGNLHLSRICKGAGLGGNYHDKIRDGSFEYYAFIEPIVTNDGKGIGPLIMASIEMERRQ